MKHIPNLRWWIAGLLAAASALAYVDRQTLPVVIGEIQKTIPITDLQFGRLQFMFLLAYGIMYAVGGKITDMLGARWGYVVFIVWWSAANLSSYLIRRKLSVDTSRKICLGVSAACMPVSLLISVSPLAVTIVFFSLAMLGHQFWTTIIQTLTADMFPSAVVGSVAGLLGSVGAFGGMLFNLIVGALLAAYHSYALVFTIAGLLHPMALVVILLIVRKIEPVILSGIYERESAPA
ncbi:MAG: MFS transporter [Terracidiphilus sp.]